MVVSNIRLIKRSVLLLFFLLVSIFYSRFLNFSYAEVDMLKGYLDYSTLSEEEKKEEVNLIYKYAKKAYMENDIETAKTLFYHVLELDPYHMGANKYIEYIIPKRIASSKHSKAKEIKVILDKREELELSNLEKDIKSARRLMEIMEKERTAKETLYKSQLNKSEKDINRKANIKSEKKKRAEETVERKKRARLEKQRKIEEEKELRRQKRKNIAKERNIKEKNKEMLPSEGRELMKDSLQAVEDMERQAEEKLVNKIDAKKKTSWKMMKKELDSLQKENKRLLVRKERERRKKELKENKKKQREQKEQDKINKIEKKRREREEAKANSPKYRIRQERIRAAKDKKEELVLKKEVLRQQRLKKQIPQKTATVLNRHQQRIEAALKKQDRKARIKALYKEGIYCYKTRKYNLAKEAFAKILEIDSRHQKALDYLYIYIPEVQDNNE